METVSMFVTFLMMLVNMSFGSAISGGTKDRFQLISNISFPQQIIWISTIDMLIVQDENVFKYNILTKKRKNVSSRGVNDFVGIRKDSSVFFCEFEHFIIHSEKEFSTRFRVKDSYGNMFKEYYFFETIRPIYLDDEKILAVTALDFLEEHFYEINLDTGKKEEILSPIKNQRVKIPKDFELAKAYILNEQQYAVEDVLGNVYIYNNLDSTKTIIPMLIDILKTMPTKKPMNEPMPDFKLSFISFFAYIYSNKTAPRNGPKIMPTTLPSKAPTTPPTIAPITPHLDPPNFFVPIAATTLSKKVEAILMTKRKSSIKGVMTRKPPIQATKSVARYISQIPGKESTVKTNPLTANTEDIM